MSSITSVIHKANSSEKTYFIKDKEAVKSIKFDGATYKPDANGKIELLYDFESVLKKYNTLSVEHISYEDFKSSNIESFLKSTFYIIDEEPNSDNIDKNFTAQTVFFCDENKDLIKLITPTAKFESEDIDFGNLFATDTYSSFEEFVNFFNETEKIQTAKIYGVYLEDPNIIYIDEGKSFSNCYIYNNKINGGAYSYLVFDGQDQNPAQEGYYMFHTIEIVENNDTTKYYFTNKYKKLLKSETESNNVFAKEFLYKE